MIVTFSIYQKNCKQYISQGNENPLRPDNLKTIDSSNLDAGPAVILAPS